MKVVVLGANGFIGSNIIKYLLDNDIQVLAIVRSQNKSIFKNNELVSIITYKEYFDYDISSFDAVINCAGVAHIFSKRKIYYDVFHTNTSLSVKLFNHAVKNSVEKFINISSASVYGELFSEEPVKETVDKNPNTIYGCSKLLTENIISELQSEFSVTKVINLRPPIVYGKDAPGNFERLRQFTMIGIPLPIKNIKGKRSVLNIINLCDFIIVCLQYDLSESITLNISDPKPINLNEFINIIDYYSGQKTKSFSINKYILKALFFAIGKKETFNKLQHGMVLDISSIKKTFNWQPKDFYEISNNISIHPES
jgi:nucleoside-diphosphate-sugar epimerase